MDDLVRIWNPNELAPRCPRSDLPPRCPRPDRDPSGPRILTTGPLTLVGPHSSVGPGLHPDFGPRYTRLKQDPTIPPTPPGPRTPMSRSGLRSLRTSDISSNVDPDVHDRTTTPTTLVGPLTYLDLRTRLPWSDLPPPPDRSRFKMTVLGLNPQVSFRKTNEKRRGYASHRER